MFYSFRFHCVNHATKYGVRPAYDMRMHNILTNWPGTRAAYVRRTHNVCQRTCGVRAAYVHAAGAYKHRRKHSLRKHTHSIPTAHVRRTCGVRAAYVQHTCGVRAVCMANYLNPAFEDYRATIADRQWITLTTH